HGGGGGQPADDRLHPQVRVEHGRGNRHRAVLEGLQTQFDGRRLRAGTPPVAPEATRREAAPHAAGEESGEETHWCTLLEKEEDRDSPRPPPLRARRTHPGSLFRTVLAQEKK